MGAADFRWDAPGPGTWFLAREHIPLPVTRLYFEILSVATTGWDRSAEIYGLPDGPVRWGFVNGWMYFGGRPADPATVAERERAAAETLRTERWNDDVRRWHDELKPGVVAANRALQAEDPAAMDDDALAQHADRVVTHILDVFTIHFAHANAYSVGGGALMERLLGEGMTREELAAQLGGGSPASARARELIDAIVAEVGGREVRTIEDLRGEALDAYLGEYGWRTSGREELRGKVLAERPDLVVAAVRARQRGVGGTTQPASTGHPDVDALRRLYGLNDDNGGIVGNWPLGLVRRAGLELARRVGCLEPNDVFETTPDEFRAILTTRSPDTQVLRRRAEARAAAELADPPTVLTGPDMPAPVVELPPSVARIDALRSVLWMDDFRSEEPLQGVGIGSEGYRGRACVIDDGGLDELEPGDVLVAYVTHSGHNAVFPIAGAVVTEAGGLLSHPAVLARELGLPAVVGVRDLLARVKTGDVVEVDPVAGAVRVIDPA